MVRSTVKNRYFKKFYGGGSGFLTIFAVVILFFWNWSLVLATLAGVITMLAVYQFSDPEWYRTWLDLARGLTGFNRRFIIAVTSGALTSLGIYLVIQLWHSLGNPWLFAWTFGQGIVSLLTLLLLLRQFVGPSKLTSSLVWDDWISQLTDPNSVKRLIAVTQLIRITEDAYNSEDYYHQVIACFRLMLSQEKEPLIRETITVYLQKFGIRQSSSPDLSIPLLPLPTYSEEFIAPIDFQR